MPRRSRIRVQVMTAGKSIEKNKFVVLGRAGLDLYPEPPGTAIEDAGSYAAHLGGSSANIAVAIAKLGGEASLVTSVSDDAIGLFCSRELAKYGVDCTHVRAVGGRASNPLAFAETRWHGYNCVLYRNGASDIEVTREDVEAVDYGSYGALIATGTVFAAEPSRSSSFRAFELAGSKGLPIVFDLDYRSYSWPAPEAAAETYAQVCELSDIVVGNDTEFDIFAGGTGKGLRKARDLAADGAKTVVYKMGERGAVTIANGVEFRTGIYKTEPLKPVGAGDGFMGGFIVSLAQGRELRECVFRGSACAAIVVSHVGCTPAFPHADELDEFVGSRPAPSAVSSDEA